MQKAETISAVCDALAAGDKAGVISIARREYPFVPQQSRKRKYTPLQSQQIFVRDGFIDRYTGKRLVFPGTLRLLSRLLPKEFPAHKNWKMAESHLVYWELFPTVDHVQPVARGGPDEASNWVCTSMATNQVKLNWTLEELGWTLKPAGNCGEWDGLTGWFCDYVAGHSEWLEEAYLRRWHSAAQRVRDVAEHH